MTFADAIRHDTGRYENKSVSSGRSRPAEGEFRAALGTASGISEIARIVCRLGVAKMGLKQIIASDKKPDFAWT